MIEEIAVQPPGPRRRGRALLVACALVVAVPVWWSWPLALHLKTHTLVREPAAPALDAASLSHADWDLILANDQNLSLWGASANARALLHADLGTLLTQGQCYPTPDSTMLGEHMFELGVLAAPWWVLTHDPVATYNLALLTALLVAASGMFLFVERHTASTAAAIVGAVAFALAVPRISDLPYHPAVVGTEWIPWVLWAFDAALDGKHRGPALVLMGITLALAMLVGSYPLVAIGIVGGAYGTVDIGVRWYRGRLALRTIVECVVAALPAFVLTGALLLRYAAVQREWMLPPIAAPKFFVDLPDYLPGGLMSPGLAALAGVTLLAALWRGAGGRAIAGLIAATLAAALIATRVELGGQPVSVYESLARVVPLLDFVRAPGKAALAVCFGIQALGAIGWSRCFERMQGRSVAALAAILVAITCLEIRPPAFASVVLGSGAPVQLREVAPERSRIDAMAAVLTSSLDPRPVLDLPTGRMVKAPVALLDAAYHGHATSACYNSLIPPVMRQVYALADRSHSREGVDELAAAGFGFVIERALHSAAALSPMSFPAPARLLTFEEGMAIWGLPQPILVHRDPSKLALVVTGGSTRSTAFAPDPPFELDVEVTNRSDAVWALPQPVAPVVADVEMHGEGGAEFHSQARGVLPLALAGGATTRFPLVMPEAPAAGSWKATVRIEGLPQISVAPDFRWTDEER